MTVTIETSGIQELEQLLTMLKTLNITNVQVRGTKPVPVLLKGNKEEDPRELFGIWKDHPRSIKEIRSAGWNRNRDL